jgi:phosphoribosylformylglycinamidine cyclo-ligase
MKEEAIGILRDGEADLRQDAYARAGVNIDAGNEAVSRYKALAAGWKHPLQIGQIGGFSGLFRIPGDGKRALVGSTDGVGTKVLIAAELGRFDTVGADLVNHCVNDIVVTSATPLFFLDYFAVGKLDAQVAADVVGGVATACRAHDMALLGGETAEMPGVYAPGHFDIAGTIVGIVDVDDVPDPANVQPGDAIVGFPAIGLHTNGYSLARSLIPSNEWSATLEDGTVIADALLAPHPSYYAEVRAVQAVTRIRSMAHITGGGLLENVPRTLPPACKAVFEAARWRVPAIEAELVRRGALSYEERYRTLNMGVGFTVIVPFDDVEKVTAAVPGSALVGWIEKRNDGEPAVIVHPAREG